MATRYQHVNDDLRRNIKTFRGLVPVVATETQTETSQGVTDGVKWSEAAFLLVTVAEAGGFEPPVPRGTLAFKWCRCPFTAVRTRTDLRKQQRQQPP